jgi:uncharacterized phage protein (TIGR01671 family)
MNWSQMTPREIKFRAWDGQCMIDWLTINQTAFNFKVDTPLLWKVFHDPHIIRMQFTGLHDKNDTPIYEGDILRHTYDDDYDDDVRIHVVRYGEWNCGCCDSIYGFNFGSWRSDEYEVIGNVFEHPHLLETENRQ